MRKFTLKIVYTALCISLSLVLPFLTGQIPEIGNMLCPLHIPAFLCGFLCGFPWGMAAGFISPILRSLIFTMPPMYPTAVAMAFELMFYGLGAGLLYKLLPKKIPYVYVSLVASMVIGRAAFGITRSVMAMAEGSTFPFEVFFAEAVVNAIPGIILHLIIVPLIVIALRKAKLILND